MIEEDFGVGVVGIGLVGVLVVVCVVEVLDVFWF